MTHPWRANAATLGLVAFAILVPAVAVPQSRGGGERELESVRATLGQYCLSCHNGTAEVAGLNLEALDLSRPGGDAEIWENVVRRIRSGAMPPAGMPRPDELFPRFQSRVFCRISVSMASITTSLLITSRCLTSPLLRCCRASPPASTGCGHPMV